MHVLLIYSTLYAEFQHIARIPKVENENCNAWRKYETRDEIRCIPQA